MSFWKVPSTSYHYKWHFMPSTNDQPDHDQQMGTIN